MLEFKVKSIISNDKTTQNLTVYLFNREQQILLPIKMNTYAANKILLAQDTNAEIRPHIHNTVPRIVKALKGRMLGVKIYGYNEDIFYAYIMVQTKNSKKTRTLEIDCKPSDAISIALRENISIYVEKYVYKNAGIKVTKELLAKAI